MPLKKEGIMKHDSDGQRRLTRVRLCALAVLLAPLLAACAGSSAPPAAGTAPAATAAETPPATTATAGSTAQAGAATAADLAPPDQQVLRIAWAEPKTLDPLTVHAANDVAIAGQALRPPYTPRTRP